MQQLEQPFQSSLLNNFDIFADCGDPQVFDTAFSLCLAIKMS
jgi:hypothetical protein